MAIESNNAARVGDIMARHPASIKTGTSLTEVVEVLLRQRMIGLPVVDDSERVVGFVSEQDCLRTLLVSSYHAEGSPTVEDVMFTEPLTIKEEDTVLDLAEMMLRQKPKIYPVVDEGGRLKGLLMRSQVLACLIESRR
jgi:CBS domain-containing protein